MSRAGLAGLLVGPLVVGVAAGDSQSITLVINGESSGGSAQMSCDQAAAFIKQNASLITQVGCDIFANCRYFTDIHSACAQVLKPKDLAQEWEDKVLSQFALSDQCAGLSVAWYGGIPLSAELRAAMSNPHWSLDIGYVPGNDTQGYIMVSPDSGSVIKSRGNPKKLAEEACAVMKGKGGAIIK